MKFTIDKKLTEERLLELTHWNCLPTGFVDMLHTVFEGVVVEYDDTQSLKKIDDLLLRNDDGELILPDKHLNYSEGICWCGLNHLMFDTKFNYQSSLIKRIKSFLIIRGLNSDKASTLIFHAINLLHIFTILHSPYDFNADILEDWHFDCGGAFEAKDRQIVLNTLMNLVLCLIKHNPDFFSEWDNFTKIKDIKEKRELFKQKIEYIYSKSSCLVDMNGLDDFMNGTIGDILKSATIIQYTIKGRFMSR